MLYKIISTLVIYTLDGLSGSKSDLGRSSVYVFSIIKALPIYYKLPFYSLLIILQYIPIFFYLKPCTVLSDKKLKKYLSFADKFIPGESLVFKFVKTFALISFYDRGNDL
jgi:branched-subunit amino acid transport protein AzlD